MAQNTLEIVTFLWGFVVTLSLLRMFLSLLIREMTAFARRVRR